MKQRSFFMVLVGLLVAALVLGACTPAEPQVVEKVVKETVVFWTRISRPNSRLCST